ncbi:hypothetical protein [Parasphingorhabdus sp.]
MIKAKPIPGHSKQLNPLYAIAGESPVSIPAALAIEQLQER